MFKHRMSRTLSSWRWCWVTSGLRRKRKEWLGISTFWMPPWQHPTISQSSHRHWWRNSSSVYRYRYFLRYKNFTWKLRLKDINKLYCFCWSIKTVFIITQEAYPVKLKQVHVINISPLVDKIVQFVKPFLKEKIRERVRAYQCE